MPRPSRYPLELRRRAVRMIAEVRDDYPNALQAVAAKLDIGSRETLRNWAKQHEIDAAHGQEAGSVLVLRAVEANGDMDSYFQFHIEQELVRNHQARYQDGCRLMA
jgi:transposase-like protein